MAKVKKLLDPFSTVEQIDRALRVGTINEIQAAGLKERLRRRNEPPAISPPQGASGDTSSTQYVYAVDRTRAVEHVESLINDRVRQGWEFVTAYASTGGLGANFGTNVLIFRKKYG